MAKKKPKTKKIIKYRKPRNINVGMIIFACIFIYMAFSVYAYITKEKVQFYEVTEGNIVKNRYYTGLIIREEEVEHTDQAGHINYYVREGKKVAVGSTIYSIDETGALKTLLSENMDESVPLKDEQVQLIKNQLSTFSLHFDHMNYYSVYNLKNSLESTVLDHMNDQILDYIDSLVDQQGISFKQIRAKRAGVVSYIIDEYEGFDPSQITESDFDRNNQKRNVVKPGDMIEKEAPVFKYILSDQWSVLFPLSDNDIKEYSQEEELQIKFLGRDYTVSAGYSVFVGADGNKYGKLNFNKYILQFLSERYIDFEIIAERSAGLKIPVSSVTSKNFFLVPEGFLAQGGNSSDSGFYKEVYSESGSSIQFISTTLYYSDGEYYYIDSDEGMNIKAGDYIVKPDSSDRYQIGATAALDGVYNINKGYTVFKQIEVADQNDEYYTVKKNTKYGLAVYDHIVLDADMVEKEGVFIYR